MPETHKKNLGTVFLVGAGPGDPGLITVKGLDLLQQADVIIHDSLLSPELLKQARPDAQIINVGKRGRNHRAVQDEINQLLVDHASSGKMVVRLKGGDPFIFGRGAEEAAYLADAGIKCVIVPGISSGFAAPVLAGIALTHRKIASSVTFITGHEDPEKDHATIDYKALARMIDQGGTVCIFMAMARLKQIAKKLMKNGVPADMPAATVQWGSWAKQRSVQTTLENLPKDVKKLGMGSPAIVVVGKVVAMEMKGMDHFVTRPLFGKRVITTRMPTEADKLSDLLTESGAEVLPAPTIEIADPDDWQPIDRSITAMAQYDWLILTSGHGVQALAARLKVLGLDARHLGHPDRGGVKVAVVGDATVNHLRKLLGIDADAVPERFTAENLAEHLIRHESIAGKKILFLKADIAKKTLPRMLVEAGALVDEQAVYQTRCAAELPSDVVDSLRQKQVDWITFTSSSTARNMLKLLGDEKKLLNKVKIASIGPVTSETINQLGLEVSAEAARSDMLGLVQAMVDAENEIQNSEK